MMIVTQAAVVHIVGIETLIGGNPDIIVAFQQVGHIQAPQTVHDRRYLPAFQSSVNFTNAIESIININPYCPILFNVANADIWCITLTMKTADVTDTTIVSKGITIDGIARQMPQGAL